MSKESFVILKEELTAGQLVMIRNHDSYYNDIEEYQKWVIEENSIYICGYTEKDSISMPTFLSYYVGIDIDIIIWGSGLNDIKLG
jgi:hypothetical protein